MNKEKVIKTAFCVFADGYFEARSPMLPYTIGVGSTKDEAMSEFHRLVEEWDLEWKDKGGPPEPARYPETFGLRQETERVLHQIKQQYGCTLDEALDILAARYTHMVMPEGAPSPK
jgi:predicted RNase H-like HicB family nuclease